MPSRPVNCGDKQTSSHCASRFWVRSLGVANQFFARVQLTHDYFSLYKFKRHPSTGRIPAIRAKCGRFAGWGDGPGCWANSGSPRTSTNARAYRACDDGHGCGSFCCRDAHAFWVSGRIGVDFGRHALVCLLGAPHPQEKVGPNRAPASGCFSIGAGAWPATLPKSGLSKSGSIPRPLSSNVSELPQVAGVIPAQKKSPARVAAQTDQKRTSIASAGVMEAQSPPHYSGQEAGNDVAPERISPDARWEAPELGRLGNFVPALRADTSPQKDPSLPSAAVSTPRAATPASATRQAASPSSQLAARPHAPELFEAPSWSGTSVTSADPLRDAWSFRPKESVEARSFAPDAGSTDENALQSYAPIPVPPGPHSIESDLEVVQRKIKAMADEVNASEASRMKPIAEQKPAIEPSRTYTATALPANKVASPQGSAGFGTAAMAIEDGISALKSAAGAMRAPGAPNSATVEPATGGRAKSMLPPADLLIPASAQTIAVSARPAPAQPEATLASRSSGDATSASKQTDMPPAFDMEMQALTASAPVRDGRVAEIAKAIEVKGHGCLVDTYRRPR